MSWLAAFGAGMDISWWPRVVEGASLLLAIELAVALLRRRGLHIGWLGHCWAVLLAILFATRGSLPGGLSFGSYLVAAALSGVVVFALLDTFVLARPWAPERGPMLPRLAKDMLRVALALSFVLLVMAGMGDQSLKAVLVSSTVVSAVLGFALQDVLKNVFAGLALDLEKPFQRGDWLVLTGNPPAQVIDITWRSTWLRTAEGHDFFEPNALMNNERLESLGHGERPAAFALSVRLPYELPPAEARELLLVAAKGASMVAPSPGPEAFLDHFGDSGIVYSLRAWTYDVGRLTRFRDEVQSRVWYEVARRGHSIPLPIRTVRLHQVDAEIQQRDDQRSQDTSRRLRTLPLFAGLTEEAITALASRARLVPWDSGEELVHEGDLGDSLFIVTRGELDVVRRASDGDPVIVGTLGEGEFFGEASLLTGSPRTATVRARTATEVLILAREALAPLLEADPSIAEVLSRALAERRARTQASLESDARDHREAGSDEAESLLARMRSFFRLD